MANDRILLFNRKVLEIFRAAIDCPTKDREKLLDARCGSDAELRCEVESLLINDGKSWSALEKPPLFSSLRRSQAITDDLLEITPPASQIGRYRIIEPAGHGAMGMIYRAEQDYPKRQVALKLMRPGRESRTLARRFMREAGTLARLRHPGIAQIYDAGAERIDGMEYPYLVMEFIEGRSLREWIEQRSSRDVRRTVLLLIRICEAVQHAHQHGVIHRDLKPENIMVESVDADFRPRVLDFGVARLIDAESPASTLATEAGQIIGTLAYMSPEQMDGAADTRTDVYALGVILYELLTGTLPIDVRRDTLLKAMQRIREEPPAAIGRFSASLRGDLELIVEKALEKDPQQRYASVGELADDLKRYLACEPIQARKAGMMYRLVKFTRRRRGLAVSVCLLLLTVVGGAAWGLYGLARANQALKDLGEMSTFLVADVVIALDQIAGTTEVRRRLLSRLESQVEALLELQPRDQALLLAHAELLVRISDIDREEARYDESLALRMRALALRDHAAGLSELDANSQADYAIHLVKIGDIYNGWGDRLVAREWYEKARLIHERLVVEYPGARRYLDDLSWSYGRLANLATMFGRLDEAESLMRRRLEIMERMLIDYPDDALVFHGLRAAHVALAQFSEKWNSDANLALIHEEKAVEAARQVVRLAPYKRVYVADAAAALIQMANSLCRIQDFEAAEALIDETYRIIGPVLADPDSQWTAIHLIKFEQLEERLAARRRDHAKAYEHARRALEIVMQREDDYYFRDSRLRRLATCARLSNQMGNHELAREYALNVVAEADTMRDRFWNDPGFLRTCAESLTNEAVVDLADRWFIIEIQQRIIELTDGASADDWHKLGRSYQIFGEYDAALECMDNALARAVDQDWHGRCTIEDELLRLRR